MSGVYWEYVAGYIKNLHNGSDIVTNFINTVEQDCKYADKYETFFDWKVIRGDAMFETSTDILGAYGWHSDLVAGNYGYGYSMLCRRRR